MDVIARWTATRILNGPRFSRVSAFRVIPGKGAKLAHKVIPTVTYLPTHLTTTKFRASEFDGYKCIRYLSYVSLGSSLTRHWVADTKNCFRIAGCSDISARFNTTRSSCQKGNF